MKIVWTPEAVRDRDDIWLHISTDNPRAAIRMDELFSDAVAALADFPESGRPGVVPGTRELIPHESYRVVYAVADGTVWILALVHAARQWPPTRAED
ncbi:type II toxin-antitoxin system mRNA interferase toxin, RelE/StbE family [Brevundimonas lenta]|uniref:Addiction module RelE/StbE family toxin n=1 Tax=Brevundimonas lenta TaxID=424796 RepID=A0A7W6JES6_9CAUL|nr:addiction module RelE/StbE family toxin [Brevundimonas lenta]